MTIDELNEKFASESFVGPLVAFIRMLNTYHGGYPLRRNPEMIEEIINRAYALLQKNLDKIKPGYELSYARTTCKNLFMQQLKGRGDGGGREVSLGELETVLESPSFQDDPQSVGVDLLDKKTKREIVIKVAPKLRSKNDQNMVLYLFRDRMPPAAVAVKLGIRMNTFYTRKSRLMPRLIELVEEELRQRE